MKLQTLLPAPVVSFASMILLAAMFAAHPAGAQADKPAGYGTESLVIESADTTYRFNADGTGEKMSTIRIRLQSEAGARQFSVLSVPFAAANEKPSITKVVVRHADGSTTETPSSDAMEMPAPVTQQAPLYSDLKMLQIPVRGLRAGDTLEYTMRVERKNPEAPAQFWERYQFTRNFVVLSETLTLDVPASKYVQQWSASTQPQVSEKGGRKVFVWHTSQLTPTPSGSAKGEDDSEARAAKTDVAWSTFHTWAEVGQWYGSLAGPRAVPNDAIRAQAEELTRDAKSPSEQVQALYAFVSTHIRYVGIDFGVGRFQPHAAAEVLASRYGDCKDKDTLFEALLRAKGISSSPALIGASLDLVPDLPSPVFFDHVMTTVDLSGGRVWADTTPGVTPFQLLLAPLRDKQALVIPQQGSPVLDRTPTNAPFAFKDELVAEATLNKDGELKGKVNITFRSDSEPVVRAIALNLAPAQWDQGAQLIASGLGYGGTVSNSQFEHPEDVTQPMHVRYDYTRKPYGDWDNFRIVPLLPVVSLPASPEKKPAKDIDLGAPRTEKSRSSIHLPEGFGADLPDAVHVKAPFGSVDKTYRLDGGDLIVEREVVIAKGKLPADSWEEYKKFIESSSLEDTTWIQLTSKNNTQAGPHPPKPGENNPAAATLVYEATELEKRQDWVAATRKLDEAKKLNPEQPFLWSNYGYIAMVQNRPEEAAEGYRHELRNYPGESYVVTLFAGMLMRRSQQGEALSVLQTSFDRDSTEPQVALMLAAVETPDHPERAIATLQKALEAKPKEPQLMSQLVPLLLQKGKDAEARDVANKILEVAGDDPNLLNNGAYSVAESGADLETAEKSARKALDILDGQTASARVSEANQQSFMRSSLLTATWDTLGYILLKQNRVDEALDYLEAAWRNRPEPTVGLHYGSALEAAGKKSEALRVYQLSSSDARGAAAQTNPDWQPLKDRTERLKKAGIRPAATGSKEQSLQEERTFRLTLPSACSSYESATFRLQLTSSADPEVMKVSGHGLPDGADDGLKKLKLPHLVPSASKSRLLRNAVVTCSARNATAYVVLMPLGGINAERVGD